jgi:hypothetical protein
MPEAKFTGPEFVPEHDQIRLTGQIDRIRAFMLDGLWHTYEEVARATKSPATSVSSQLRNLRMAENGGYSVERRNRGIRGNGLFEYRMTVTLVDKATLEAQVQRRREILAEAEARYVRAKDQVALAEAELAAYNKPFGQGELF